MNLQEEKIKIIITDDHSIFRSGIQNALAPKKDINIIGEAEHGVDLLQKLEYLQPDIILLDIQMPLMDGITVLPILKKKYPSIKVIILSFLNDPGIICRMIELGANGYLTSERGADEIYQTIVACHKDWFYINDIVIHAFASRKIENTSEQPFKFSDNELRILKLLKKGKSIKEIGAEVDLSDRTVGAIIDKLKLRAQLLSNELNVQESRR